MIYEVINFYLQNNVNNSTECCVVSCREFHRVSCRVVSCRVVNSTVSCRVVLIDASLGNVYLFIIWLF